MILKLCGIDTGWDTFAFEARAFTYKVQQLSLSLVQGKVRALACIFLELRSLALPLTYIHDRFDCSDVYK